VTTLIIAIRCSDGVVIASDSAASDAESGTKQPIKKIRKIPEAPILYGGSGSVGLLQKISEAINKFKVKQHDDIGKIRSRLKSLIVPKLKESRELHVPYPQFPYDKPPAAVVLFAGVHDKEPWILEIEKDGSDTMYDEELGGFAAIGSGKLLAQAIFRPHLMTPRDLSLGKVFAYRVIEDSVELAAGGLALPVQMHSISIDGKVQQIKDEELRSLADTCQGWRSLERETVGKLLSPDREEDVSPPKP